jgi:hypothetical protein
VSCAAFLFALAGGTDMSASRWLVALFFLIAAIRNNLHSHQQRFAPEFQCVEIAV